MLAYPAVERGFVVLGRSGDVFIQPLVKGVLQRVNIPSGAFAANLGNGLLGKRADNRA
jgi:hypothetical protein